MLVFPVSRGHLQPILHDEKNKFPHRQRIREELMEVWEILKTPYRLNVNCLTLQPLMPYALWNFIMSIQNHL